MKQALCRLYQNREMNAGCVLCEFYVDCAKHFGNPYRTFKQAVSRINEFKPGCTEVLVYKQPFQVLDEYGNLTNEEIERNFRKVRHESYGTILIPRTEKIRFQNLIDSLNKSRKFALDRYYSYARANEWKYFFTFTFDKEKVKNRYDDDECRYCWKLFRQQMQRLDPEVKLLASPEYHSDKGKGVAIHFHGLMDTKIDFVLRPFKDPKTGKWKTSANDDPLFEFDFWKYGMATCCVLPKGTDCPKVISYVQKYISKGEGVGYGKRRFYATQNLSEKETRVVDQNEADEYLAKHDLYVYKDTETMTVYRSWK